MVLIDTNVLVNYCLRPLLELTDDEINNIDEFTKLSPIERLIPDFVLCEFSIVMFKVVPRKYQSRIMVKEQQIAKIANKFFEMGNISYQVIQADTEELAKAIKSIQQDSSSNSSLADWMLVSISQARKLKVLTSDKTVNSLLAKQS